MKVLGSDGTATKLAAVAGWTVANRGRYGIEAVNMSLGGEGCSDGTDVMSRAANRAGRTVCSRSPRQTAGGSRGPDLDFGWDGLDA